jgi:molybdate transport system substrate-binding protein
MKSRCLLFICLAMGLVGCTGSPTTISVVGEASPPQVVITSELPPSNPDEKAVLNVFAAASLTEPFDEIGKLFKDNHPGVSIVFNFAGSQQLAQQINEGAPADVFASANKEQMDNVIEAGEIIRGTQQPFVQNRLVVIYPQDNPTGLAKLQDLAKPGIHLVLAAQEVPVGGYAQNFLDKATAEPAFSKSFKNEVLANVVSYEDNVKAVLTKVVLGEADAGIVYTSDISGQDAHEVGKLEIPEALNIMADYPIAPIKNSPHPELARAFIALVLAPEGQAIMVKYNFIPVKK